MVRVAIGTPQPASDPPAVVIDPQQRVEVSTKSTWEGSWEPQPNIVPLKAVWAAPPSLSEATFRHDFGERLLTQKTAFETIDSLSIRDHYIKVEVFTSEDVTVPINTWVGQIVDDTRDIHGRDASASKAKEGGSQRLTAYGLEHIFRKCPIDETCFREFDSGWSEKKGRVRTRMVFNQGTLDGALVGNKTSARHNLDGEDGESYLFDTDRTSRGPDQEPTAFWSYTNIIEYLLTRFVNTRTTPQFALPESSAGEIGAGSSEPITIVRIEDLFGMTVWDALNKMLDRRRGFGWGIRTNGDDVVIDLVVWTIVRRSFRVGRTLIPKNTNQVIKRLDKTILIPAGGLEIGDNANRQYGNVLIQGAPIRCMFTVSNIDRTLQKGWTDTDEDIYKIGAQAADGYSAMPHWEKAALNDKRRREDPRINYVWLRHVIPDGFFSWRVGMSNVVGGTGNPPLDINVLPTAEEGRGTVEIDKDTKPPYANKLHRLLDFLPMHVGVDYSVAQDPGASSNAGAKFARPIVTVIKTQNVHELVTTGGADDQFPVSSVHMLTDRMGFDLVLASANHMPHNWAGTNPTLGFSKNWDAANGEYEQPAVLPPHPSDSRDYRGLVATVAVDTDERIRIRINTRRWTPDNDTSLVLEFPHLQFWHAAAGTIVGHDLTGGVKRLHEDNRILRDDTEQLREIAGFVGAWYSEIRRSIRLTWRTYDFFEVGSLLLAISSGANVKAFNTVITRVVWDFQNVTTTISSEYADLDFARLFGGTSRVI